MRMGNMAISLICHIAAWVEERCPPSNHTSCPSMPEAGVRAVLEVKRAGAARRSDPAPHLSSTIELTLLAEVWMSQEVVSMGELFSLLYHAVVWEGERCFL